MKKYNLGRKILPPPPFPPLILMKEFEKYIRLPIYQPNRDIYGDVTLSLGNTINVERHIRDMDFEREKEYNKKEEMCRDFKETKKKDSSNLLSTLTPSFNINFKKTSKKDSKKDSKKSLKKLKKKKNKTTRKNIKKDRIVLRINTKVDPLEYKDNLLKWKD